MRIFDPPNGRSPTLADCSGQATGKLASPALSHCAPLGSRPFAHLRLLAFPYKEQDFSSLRRARSCITRPLPQYSRWAPWGSSRTPPPPTIAPIRRWSNCIRARVAHPAGRDRQHQCDCRSADVLALTFAVTYRDQLGWKDTFAQPDYPLPAGFRPRRGSRGRRHAANHHQRAGRHQWRRRSPADLGHSRRGPAVRQGRQSGLPAAKY